MRRTIAALMLGAGILPGAAIVASSQRGNFILLQLDEGSAQIEWLSDSSFRFSRRLHGSFPQRAAKSVEPVALKISDTPDAVTVATKYLLVTVRKRGVLVGVAEPDGAPVMTDASEVQFRDGMVAWERAAPAGVRFFGLGARDGAVVELRGTVAAAAKPFLLSSAGYAEFHVAPANYSFDLARAKVDRYRIEARGASEVDYYFFFGPAPKEILEQYLILDGPMERLSNFGLLRPSKAPARAAVLNTRSLETTIHSLVNGSLSGVLLAALSLDAAADRRRAIQLGSVVPVVLGSHPEWLRGTLRSDLAAYFATYAEEARDRGLPLLRALPMQFPKDAEAAKVNDEFMAGDELLVAPIYQNGSSRRVYLPMGIWTRLGDNRTFPGRQTITIEARAEELPLFSRNGSILPLGSDPMKLHYFPRLGGEFFLFEAELEEYSQVHAAPAGDFMRLEIESKKDRAYEWIVHHVARPKRVASGGIELGAEAWFWDSTERNLHVRVGARAGEDEIVSVAF